MSNFEDSRSIAARFSLRDSAAIISIAILGPLAVQGVLLSTLWILAQFGSSGPESIGDVIFLTGSTISQALILFLILVLRYFTLSAYWLLIAERFGQRRLHAFLAALPIVGIWWSITMSSHIVRNRNAISQVPFETKRIIAIILGLSLLVLPASMQVATAGEKAEVRHLAQPCLEEFNSTESESPALSLGERGLSQGNFDQLVDEVKNQQRGAAARLREDWNLAVANQQIQMARIAQSATDLKLVVTIGEAEDQIAQWQGAYGSDTALRDVLSDIAVPESELFEFTCTRLLDDQIRLKYPDETDADGVNPFIVFAQKTVTKAGILVDPSIGFWNQDLLVITADPVAGQVDEQEQLDETAEQAQQTARTFSTRVEYETAAIPNTEFPDSLEWKADICSGATQLEQSRYLSRVQLFERKEGNWVLVRSARASAERGGRCPGGSVNLLIGTKEAESTLNWTDKGWTTCRAYQVRFPETPSFQGTSVDLCVSTKAVTTEEGV